MIHTFFNGIKGFIKKLSILRLAPNLKIAGTLVTNSVVFFGTKKDVSFEEHFISHHISG